MQRHLKQYAYFPGCNTEGISAELDLSMRTIAPLLGIELIDIPEFVCCGAGMVREQDAYAELSLCSRNFALAEALELPILTVCSTCQGTMNHALHVLKHDTVATQAVQARMQETPYRLRDVSSVRVVHILDLLWESRDLLRERAMSPNALTGIGIASFYGCRLLRPAGELPKERPVYSRKMEDVIEALGLTAVEYPGRTRCCGFDIAFVDKPAAKALLRKRFEEAESSKADLVVTACPLCHNILDGMQSQVREFETKTFPVLHLPQLVGLAIGVDERMLGLTRHVTGWKR